ncbi:MAG: hypothetical protein EA383_02380 [Spirochaetaceae bacterium]|nr:MAG: hypothetical protein EA383_02380 [Spirochaetaceae bacterium]
MTVGNQNYANDEFEFSFDASDTLGLKRVTITREDSFDTFTVFDEMYDSDPLAPETTASINLTQNTAQALPEGDYTYTITVEDLANRFATLSRTVVIDRTPPDVEITNLRPVLEGDGLDRVNGTIEFSVAAGDASGLVSNGVKWWIVRTDAGAVPNPAPTGFDDTRGTTFGASPYRALFDTDSGLDSDGEEMQDNTEYTLYVIARDRAGNETMVQREFLVDQDSDFPTVSFTDVDPTIDSAGELQAALDGGNQDNLLELNARIRGTIEDDDRVDASSIEISLNTENPQYSEDPGESDFDPVTSRGSSGRSVSFSHNLIAAGLSDGVHFFYLRFSDDESVKLGDTPMRTTTVGPIYFVIDTRNPDVAFASPAVNSYQQNSFSVTGTASDASGISEIAVSLDGGTTWDSENVVDTSGDDPAFATWSYLATVSEDDIVAIRVRARDAFNKETIIERQVTVDTTRPLITINEPTTGGTVNSVVLLRGITTDNFTVAASYYFIDESTLTPPHPSDDLSVWSQFDGVYSWEYYWNTLDDHDTEDAKDFTLHVAARDSAGNWSLVETSTITVDQSTNRPVVTINNPDGQLLDNTGTISGTATDDDGIDSSTMEISFDNGDTWRPVSNPGSGGFFVNWTHSLAHGDGVPERFEPYTVLVRVQDTGDTRGGHIINPVTGVSNPIEIRKNDSLPNAEITSLSNGIITTETLQGAYISDYFLIEGEAEDGVGIENVEARLVGVAGQDVFTAVDDVSGADEPYSTWQWERDSLDLTGRSTLNIEVRSTDRHGRSFTRSFTVLVDSEAPSVNIDTTSTNPDTGSGAYNRVVTFRGTSTDNVQVERIYYRFAGTDPGLPGPDFDGWSIASGIYNWNAVLDTRDVHNEDSDFEYGLYVVAVDAAGNMSEVESLTFTINQESDRPVLSVSTPTADELLGQGAKVIGSVSDDDGLSSIEIRIAEVSVWNFEPGTDDGYVAVDSPSNVSGRNVFFEHDLSGFSDGEYRVQIRVRDIHYIDDDDTPFSYVESEPVDFKVDVAPPEIMIDRMVIDARYTGEDDREITGSFNGRFINNDFTLYLDASDDSGLEFVQVRIDDGAWIDAILEDSGEFAGLYRVTIIVPDNDLDGDRTINYRARDNSGKTTARFITVVIDTKAPETEFITDSTEVYRTVRVRGLVEEENPLQQTYLWAGEANNLDPADISQAPADLTLWDRTVTGSYSWFYDFDTTLETPQGWYRLVARTRDRAGNLSEPVSLLLDLNQEADRPVITLSNLTNTANPTAGQNTLSSPIISGFVTDDDRVAGNSLQIRIREEGAPEWPAWEVLPTVDDAFFINWSYNLDLPDGVYEMGFRVLDTLAVNRNDVMDPANYAEDNYNWQELGPVRFFVAANPPEITVWDPDRGDGTGTLWSANNRKVYRSDFTVNGNVTSSSDNTFMQYRTQLVGQTWSDWVYIPGTWDGTSGTVPANTTPDWSFTVTIDETVAEGQYGLQIRAVDSLGGVTTRPGAGEQPFRYFVDRTRPVHTLVSAPTGENQIYVSGYDDVFIYGLRWVGTNPGTAHPRDWAGATDVLVNPLEEAPGFYNYGYGFDPADPEEPISSVFVIGRGGGPGDTRPTWYAMRDRSGNWTPVYYVESRSGIDNPDPEFLYDPDAAPAD